MLRDVVAILASTPEKLKREITSVFPCPARAE